jgi:hypothetical protein
MASLDHSPSFGTDTAAMDLGALVLAADRIPGPVTVTEHGDPTDHWHDSDLAGLVDLKWLMAGYGEWLDLPRLRRDDSYARAALDEAQRMPSDLIRLVARRIRSKLDAAH